MLNKFDVDAIVEAAGIMGKIIFFTYETFLNFIILNLLITGKYTTQNRLSALYRETWERLSALYREA